MRHAALLAYSALLVGLVVAGAGCAEGALPRRLAASYAASAALACPASHISLQYVAENGYVAGGCNRVTRVVCQNDDDCHVVDDGPPDTTPPKEPDATTKMLRVVLPVIPYRDCGVGGAGKVEIAIAPDGKTDSVEIVSGAYDATTSACLVERFSSVHVPGFDGTKPRSYRWGIHLPLGDGKTDDGEATSGGSIDASEASGAGADDGATATLRVILGSIPYRDCGKGGPGAVFVTLDEKGATAKVSVEAKSYSAATKACIAQRFASVQFPPLGGRGEILRWDLELPEDGGW